MFVGCIPNYRSLFRSVGTTTEAMALAVCKKKKKNR